MKKIMVVISLLMVNAHAMEPDLRDQALLERCAHCKPNIMFEPPQSYKGASFIYRYENGGFTHKYTIINESDVDSIAPADEKDMNSGNVIQSDHFCMHEIHPGYCIVMGAVILGTQDEKLMQKLIKESLKSAHSKMFRK